MQQCKNLKACKLGLILHIILYILKPSDDPALIKDSFIKLNNITEIKDSLISSDI